MKLILVVLLLVAGCATSPISTKEAKLAPDNQILNRMYMKPEPGTGKVVIKRDDGFGGSACTSKVYVDAIPVAELWRAEKVVLHLPEGDHMFGAWPNGMCGGGLSEVRGTVRAGVTITFRIGYGSNGDYFIVQTAF